MNAAASEVGSGAGASGESADPVLVEVTRGPLVESRHRAAVAVADSDGRLVLALGDVARLVYPRSAVKPIQALPFLESGAADAFGLGAEEIALACASHTGEHRHVAIVSRWLARIGCAASDLECGPQAPRTEDAARELWRAGQKPSALHNNCSGKHAGFLTLARHMGWPTAGYIAFEHPVQRAVSAALGEMCGFDPGTAPRGTDGCGIPVFGIRLAGLARAMACLAEPARESAIRRQTILRIRAAMAEHPFLVAGSGRFTTLVAKATGPRALLKGGAEGMFCAALPGAGLGIALKVESGEARAAHVVIGRLLRRFGALAEEEARSLVDQLEPTLRNWAGAEVGRIRIADGAPL